MKVLVDAPDLSGREWQKVARLLPSAKHGGRPRQPACRLSGDAIFDLVRAGGDWHLRPTIRDWLGEASLPGGTKPLRGEGAQSFCKGLSRGSVILSGVFSEPKAESARPP